MKFTDDGVPQLDPLSEEQLAMVPFVAQAWSRQEELLCESALRSVVHRAVLNRAAMDVLTEGHPNWVGKPLRTLLYMIAIGPRGNRTQPFLAALEEELREQLLHSKLLSRALSQFYPGTAVRAHTPELQKVMGVLTGAGLLEVFQRAGRMSLLEAFYCSDEPDGFFEYQMVDHDWPMKKTQVWNLAQARPRLSLHQKELAPGLTASIRAFRMSECDYETDWDVLNLDCMVLDASGRACANADALLFEPPGGGFDFGDLFEVADIFSQEQADMAHDMMQRRPEGLEDALEEGYGILHVSHCEVRADARGNGLGARFLDTVVKRARRLARRPIFVVLSVHPAQFPRLDYSRVDGTLQTMYQEALDRLSSYLSEAADGRLFPLSEHGTTWVARNGTYVRAGMEGLALLGKQMLERYGFRTM